ncbi:MAG TPA: hypothetical protein DEB44_01760, partial [Acidimicrobiaceae bacterium]|nr:hypothetical protein [Acidimicrobiaceae bacterium]
MIDTTPTTLRPSRSGAGGRLVSNSVLYEERDGIAIITINRPERLNTLTEEVIVGVAEAIDSASMSEHVSSVVLRGEGANISAGYDLNEFLESVD